MRTELEWGRLAELLGADDDAAAAVRAAGAGAGVGIVSVALIDALDDAGALACLRSEDTGMELAEALAQLPRVFLVNTNLDDASDVDDLTEATAVADRLLQADGVRLLRLDDEEDWSLSAVVASQFAEALVLATRLGFGLTPVR